MGTWFYDVIMIMNLIKIVVSVSFFTQVYLNYCHLSYKLIDFKLYNFYCCKHLLFLNFELNCPFMKVGTIN